MVLIFKYIFENKKGSINNLCKSGQWWPPKKKIAIKADIKISEEYSPKKKKTNILAPCSVINPATNSDSASGKSKGGLFVSAKIAIKKDYYYYFKTQNVRSIYFI